MKNQEKKISILPDNYIDATRCIFSLSNGQAAEIGLDSPQEVCTDASTAAAIQGIEYIQTPLDEVR